MVDREEQMKEIKYKCKPVIIINHIRETCKIINMKQNKKLLIIKAVLLRMVLQVNSPVNFYDLKNW